MECRDFEVAVLKGPHSTQFIVGGLIVEMNDEARYRAALVAMRAVILSAAKARDSKQSDEVNKRGAPKL